MVVSQVLAACPAEAARVRQGDVLLSTNGKSPASVKEAMSLFGDVAFGEKAILVIRRAGQQQNGCYQGGLIIVQAALVDYN